MSSSSPCAGGQGIGSDYRSLMNLTPKEQPQPLASTTVVIDAATGAFSSMLRITRALQSRGSCGGPPRGTEDTSLGYALQLVVDRLGPNLKPRPRCWEPGEFTRTRPSFRGRLSCPMKAASAARGVICRSSVRAKLRSTQQDDLSLDASRFEKSLTLATREEREPHGNPGLNPARCEKLEEFGEVILERTPVSPVKGGDAIEGTPAPARRVPRKTAANPRRVPSAPPAAMNP
jgi:hypothetical protein